jgi:hypothetical protein
MTNQHPITPPPELVKQWEEQFLERPTINGCFIQSYIATKAAQWGADMELKACLWHLESTRCNQIVITTLRDARRPEPPSLKEHALKELRQLPIDPELGVCASALDTIRRALEALPE